MGKQGSGEKKWVVLDSMENCRGVEQEQENGDEDEALSLCDLPNKQENQFKKESPAGCGGGAAGEEEFDFCSWGGGCLKESEMCAADEVFFQGQILPLRHSISSEGGAGAGIRSGSRCNSMDRCHSVGYTSASSRSSSTRSHQSSSSAASSITTPHGGKHHRIRNRFQYSQPSPTPQLRFSKASHCHAANNYASGRNSTLWSLFRVGLVTMPEIGSQSFRARNNDNNNNRNKVVRSGSNSSSIISNADSKTNITQKLKQRFTDKNLVFFDTCKCSFNSVETIPSNSADNKKNKKEQSTAGKQTMSRIRTFEWLKQLSLEGE